MARSAGLAVAARLLVKEKGLAQYQEGGPLDRKTLGRGEVDQRGRRGRGWGIGEGINHRWLYTYETGQPGRVVQYHRGERVHPHQLNGHPDIARVNERKLGGAFTGQQRGYRHHGNEDDQRH